MANDYGDEPLLPAIPDVRASSVEQVAQILQIMKEWIEVRQGARGDGMDRAVTLRDLLNAGIAEPGAIRGLFPGGTPPIIDIDDGTDSDIPPTPTDLEASGAIKNIILTWKFASGYSRLAYFEVWRSETDALGDATLIAQTYATVYSDFVGPGSSYYYWVRAVSDAAYSPYNAVAGTLGTTALDPAETMKAMLIRLGYNAAQIAAGVFPITTVTSLPALPSDKYPAGVMVYLTTDGKLYRSTGSSWTAAVAASDITGQIVSDQVADAAINTAKFALGIEPVALVTSLPSPSGYTGPKTVFNTTDGKLYRYASGAWTAAVPTTDLTGQITTTQITDSAVSTPKLLAGAVTTAKIAAGAVTANEIAANAIIAGKVAAGAINTAELAAGAVNTSKLAAGAVTANEIAANAIIAGKIAAGAVEADKLAANSVIAGKIAAGAIVAGDGVISNAAIGTAAIQNAAITNLKVANLAIDDAKISDMSVAKLTAGSLDVGSYVQSTGFSSGSAGFRISGNGNAEFWNGTFRGVIGATSGLIGSIVIDSTGIQSAGYNGTTGFRINSDGTAVLGTSVTVKGVLSAATGTFAGSLSAATGTFAGSLSAATGTFAGSLSAASGTFAGNLSAAGGTFAGSLSAASGTFSGTLTASAINAVDTINVAGNAITGLSASTGGSATIPASSEVFLCSASVTMPAGASGVVVTVAFTLNSASNSSQHLIIKKDGTEVSGTGISLVGGFANSASYTWVDPSPTTGSATYSFYGRNPSVGAGSGISASVTASSIIVSGAKR